MKKIYVHYGSGTSAPTDWINFDSSPTLRIQKTIIIGRLFKRFLNVVFPQNVLLGDIVNGLRITDNSCDGIFCSHVLEHLCHADLIIAINNTYKMLKPGGIFRMVLPDMEFYCNEYLSSLKNNKSDACFKLMQDSLLGSKNRKKGFLNFIQSFYGNANHLWMWDYNSLSNVLLDAGFKKIRRCEFNDCEDKMFLSVEEKNRFDNCLSIEVYK